MSYDWFRVGGLSMRKLRQSMTWGRVQWAN